MTNRLRDQCLDLADYALTDQPKELRGKATELANLIAEAIEDWIQQQKQEQEIADD